MVRFALLAFMLCVAATGARANPADASYCRHTGGVVQTRIPAYGTNNPTPLLLAGEREFCEYNAADNSSHIWVLLSTLTASKPTLVALAYYSETPFNSAGCNGGPGSCYCSQIGGTDEFGGINAAGGGWLLSTNATDVLDVCAFPDLSSIDAYGLFYHSAGIIRGRDLAHRLVYKNPYTK